jgi:hypothetical protein
MAFVTAVVHMVGHIAGPQPPANDTERQLLDLATTYHYRLPGGASRSLMNFLDGFSLTFAVFVTALGAIGLAVARRGSDDPLLMMAVARAITVACLAVTLISLWYFFIVPALFVAVVTLCFAFASVSRT